MHAMLYAALHGLFTITSTTATTDLSLAVGARDRPGAGTACMVHAHTRAHDRSTHHRAIS